MASVERCPDSPVVSVVFDANQARDSSGTTESTGCLAHPSTDVPSASRGRSPNGSMRYHNLDLWIGKRLDGGCAVRARCEDHGETDAAAALDIRALRGDLAILEDGTASHAFLVRFGTTLYEHVFATDEGRIGLHFGRCTELARISESNGVRIRLRIDDPEISTVPWEYIYSPIRSDFLGVSISTPVVRYLELPEPPRPLSSRFPLHMLVAIPEYSGLDAETEKRYLMQALDDLQAKQLIQVHVLDKKVTRARISDSLLAQRFDVFHFIGHGGFEDDEAYLVVNGEDDQDDYVDHEWMGRLFSNHPSMKLVVLNACKGAQVSTAAPLVGIAPQLVRRDIPAVVAMQYAIADEEALCFARTFYRSLFRGPDQGRVEVAVCHARNELLKEFPDTGALGAPVLFMRGAEGVLFSPEIGRGLRHLPYEPMALDTAKAVVRTHEERIESGHERKDDAFVAIEERDLHRAREQIRLRNASLWMAFGAALLAFFGLWMYAFDWLPWPLKPEYYTMAIGDAIAGGSLHEAIAIVSIDAETETLLGGELSSNWRDEHGDLVRNLALAGASVVTFDMHFPKAAEEDSAFARAMHDASARGTHVILGAKKWGEDREPKMVEILREAASSWGSLCVGVARHAPNVVPLLSITRDDTPAPALALASVAAFDGARRYDLDSDSRQVNVFDDRPIARRRIQVADVDHSGDRAGDCTIIETNDPYAELIIRYTPLDVLHDRRIAYEQVALSTAPDTLRALLEGKIVVVGLERGADELFPIHQGLGIESRYGLMLHVDALNVILQNLAIRWLGGWGQFFIIICMAAIGAAFGYAVHAKSRFHRIALVMAVPVAYLVGSVYLYLVHHVLLNGIYHVLAFLLSYWMVKKMKRRFFP